MNPKYPWADVQLAPLVSGNVILGNNLLLSSFTKITAKNNSSIFIGESSSLYPFVRILAEGKTDNLVIGKRVRIQRRSELHGNVNIGSDSIVGPDCFISSGTHLFDFVPELSINDQDKLFQSLHGDSPSDPITVGTDVWIGRLVTILPGVTIGDHSIIGANSVVTKSIPSGEVLAGSPCRFLRKRG